MGVSTWRYPLAITLAVAMFVSACGGEATPQSDAAERRRILSQEFPDVLDARFDSIGETTWSVRVTISSPYDTPERYADAWRVMTLEGAVLGERVLTHDHASEQPFTRALNNVQIPAGTDVVVIEARDLINGWSGEGIEFSLPTD